MNRIKMESPNSKINAEFAVQDFEGKKGCLTYRVRYSGRPILDWSRLGFELMDVPDLIDEFELVRSESAEYDSDWEPVAGENKRIRDHYKEYVIHVTERNKLRRKLLLTFRLYDSGVSFKYRLERCEGMKRTAIRKELTSFAFLEDHVLYATYTAQGSYEKTTIGKMKQGCERPLVLEFDGGPYIALAEAKLVNYARMKLSREEGSSFTLTCELTGKPLYCFQEEETLRDLSEISMVKVTADTSFDTPWRVIMLADTPAHLYEQNEMIMNLNDPCAIADPSFIRPGKVLREITLTTEGGIAAVNFAVRHNIQYIEFDAGWYGVEYDWASDATSVSIDPGRYKGPLDMELSIRYAKEHGIGVILYINHRAMVNQLDELLPLFKEWGVDGIKYGFVEVGTQRWTSWLHECVRKAVSYGFVLTIHDEYRPTGYQRTYPNLLTQEGIRGDEEKQPAENTLTIVFTRMLAGPGDHTVCYFDKRVDEYWSHAYQLAKAVVLFSPLQFLYWYDRPVGSFAAGADIIEQAEETRDYASLANIITEEPELEFFDRLSTTWDETRVLQGEIGKFVTMARRKGDDWFVGVMNAQEERTFEISLSFLSIDRQYITTVYSDEDTLQTRTKVKIEKIEVTKNKIIKCKIGGNQGLAMRIVPIS
ncbi:glycoside hydrolase family 97 N-terminal domain-containing protein [Paenibacillus sp. EC2-1]|uniref:glycoside hydrolase family 97 protein n=1 Tax=Paenibacillus sp. EC2-1 TaxID=3388665 RepID=UPI003BEF12FB